MAEKKSIFHVICDDPTIKNTLRDYLYRLITFCKEMEPALSDYQIVVKYASSHNAKTCGATTPDVFPELLTDPNINIRELMTPIMNISQRLCGLVWELINLYTDNNAKFNEICNKYGINKDIILERAEHIATRFGAPAKDMAGLKKNASIEYYKSLSPYPSLCHAATQSLGFTSDMTLHFDRIYPRSSAWPFIYNQILDGTDPKMEKQFIYPQLSEREKNYIVSQVDVHSDKGDFFFQNIDISNDNDNDKGKLPWECGYLSKKINPGHMYIRIAQKCNRHILLGPSGTTEFMLNVAEIFGVDLRIMTLACIAWMYIARDHALFDMMIVANTFFDNPVFDFNDGAASYEVALKNDRQQIIDLMKDVLGPGSVSGTSADEDMLNEIDFLNLICADTRQAGGADRGLDMWSPKVDVLGTRNTASQESTLLSKNWIEQRNPEIELRAENGKLKAENEKLKSLIKQDTKMFNDLEQPGYPVQTQTAATKAPSIFKSIPTTDTFNFTQSQALRSPQHLTDYDEEYVLPSVENRFENFKLPDPDPVPKATNAYRSAHINTGSKTPKANKDEPKMREKSNC